MTVMRIKTLEGKLMENIFHLHLKLKLKISEQNDGAVRSFYWASTPLKSLLIITTVCFETGHFFEEYIIFPHKW